VTSTLHVTIERANNLNEPSWWDQRDPFVEIEIAQKHWTKRRTGTKSNTQDPIWNKLVHYKDYQQGDRLLFHVWDEDHMWHDDLGDAEMTPDCKQSGTKTLKLSKSGTLTIKIECTAVPRTVAASGKKYEIMAKLAMDVYNVHNVSYEPEEDLGDWDLVHHVREWDDNLAVYQNGKECTLAFTGSEYKLADGGLRDWLTNAAAIPIPKCGNWIHLGFYNEVRRATMTSHWRNTMQPFLASDSCSGGIYVVGHSLGGAAAEVFTACVNQKKQWLWGKNFAVKEVYTIGAPAVSRRPLQQHDGCLKGARIYNEDDDQYDPVPFVAQKAGMVHPKLKAIRLREVEKEKEWKSIEFDCMSDKAHKGDKAVDNNGEAWKLVTNVRIHKREEYVARLKKIFR